MNQFCELSSLNTLFWHNLGLVAFQKVLKKTVLSFLSVLGIGSGKH